MDFINRNSQQSSNTPTFRSGNGSGNSTAPDGGASPDSPKKPVVKKEVTTSTSSDSNKWWRLGGIVFLFAIAILAVAAVGVIGFSNPSSQKYVNKNELQAVFINVNGASGGQVYFGHIEEVTNNYTRLTGVFFVQQSTQKTSSNQSLVLQKLGCQQIHDPEDQMIINNSQVLWWENLNNNGQVAKQVTQYYKANPNGQNCTTSTQSPTTSSPSSSTNGSTSSSSNQNTTSTGSSNSTSNSTTPSTSTTTPPVTTKP